MFPDSMTVYGFDLDNGRGFESIEDVKDTWNDKVPYGRKYKIQGKIFEVIKILEKPFFREESENE